MPFHHVANGTSLTRLIAAAGLPGSRSIWADPLHDGPVPGGVSDDELRDIRIAHHSAPGGPADDPVNDLRLWRAAIVGCAAGDELVLWFEHDLFDQLNLIQLLTFIRGAAAPGVAVSLISIDAFHGYARFFGMGQLRPEDIGGLFETRQPVSQDQYSIAAQAWQAFRAPTPVPLDHLRGADLRPLPFLGAALTRFLQEYPWASDGLSRTERRILQLASASAVELRAIFSAVHEGETHYYLADTELADHAGAMSETTPALLTWKRGVDDSALAGTVAIAGAGRRVLDGAADRVELCGLDRWLGGVRLAPGLPLWRWDDARRCIVAS